MTDMGKARQTVFNIMGRHPCCFRDDEPLQDLIEDLARAISGATQGSQEPAWSPAWSATVHDKIIKRLMADAGMANSISLYTAFKQFANELHALAHAAPQPLDPAYDVKEPLREALEFYADFTRYSGPNSRIQGEPDKYQPEGLYYRLDVTRDGGSIARKALTVPSTDRCTCHPYIASQYGHDKSCPLSSSDRSTP